MGKYFYQFCLILTAFLLFLFPEQCVAGAKNGLLLWSGTHRAHAPAVFSSDKPYDEIPDGPLYFLSVLSSV